MNKQVTIYSSHSEDNPPENLNRHIAWLRCLQESIPEDFRGSAKVEIEAGEYYFDYTISYLRPMTDAEIAEEQRKRKADDDWKRKQALAILAELKAKYPDA